MSKLVKLGKNTAFDNLSWQRQTAIVRLFEGKTLKEISQEVNCHLNTVENWKSMPQFQQARVEYSKYVLKQLLPDAVSELKRLINNGKSEMVKLQAIQTVLKNADLLSDNSTPELDKAKVRKANAEADITEWKRNELTGRNDSNDKTTLIDDIGGMRDDGD